MPTPRIIHADCLDALRDLPDESAHAVVTDPPYGLANTDSPHVVETLSRWFAGERDYLPSGAGFMGKAWDAFVPPPAVWDECYRVLKPGGQLLAFAGSRTQDLMGLSIRLAGFDLRDTVTWLYGSGFPKSLDVGKAIDKAAGATREVIGRKTTGMMAGQSGNLNAANGWAGGQMQVDVTAPATVEAQQWNGWGTALKPASEPIVVARKPLAGTVAANVLSHGTGALNIDACRVGTESTRRLKKGGSNDFPHEDDGWTPRDVWAGSDSGRWPANVVLDEHAAAALDEDSGHLKQGGAIAPGSKGAGARRNEVYGTDTADRGAWAPYEGSGGASRFFPVFKYQAKAPAKERPKVDGVAHPTVKPLDLMRWLVRLVTPPGGTVLEPFAGSGTTVEAALLEGFDVIGVEREADYLPLIQQRIDRVAAATEQVEDEPEGLW